MSDQRKSFAPGGPVLFGRSLAGHDFGKLYVICGTEGDALLLADGRRRTLKHPKRKNKKHVQIVKSGSDILEEIIREGRIPADEDIWKAVQEKETMNVKSRRN